MLEMHEDECCFRDLPDSAGAERDVLEGAPALGQEGEAAFSEGSYRAKERVVRLGVNVKFTSVLWLLHWREDAVTCTFVAGIGQDRHFLWCRGG